jgi:glycosyltransferase involved in cell wall biosynthesis
VRILLVADGRSPITQRWIEGLRAINYTVSLVSTFPCSLPNGVENMLVLPVAFSGMAGSQVSTKQTSEPSSSKSRGLVARFRPFLLSLRYQVGPWSTLFYQGRFRRIVAETKPDLVHALRIPYEGILASGLPSGIPLIISVWGNDLTLHAYGSHAMMDATRRTLKRANGLMADAQRDIRLGHLWGFNEKFPSLVAPGSGGIDFIEINRPLPADQNILPERLTGSPSLVVNPRGFRPGSVRNDVFFRAIPRIVERIPNVLFACTAMQGQPEALAWVHRLKITRNVKLLPYLSQPQLWELFRRAAVSISISDHDGTPNSLLEAMACGCFPIVGDIESLREWVTPGINGLLVPPDSPQSLAEAVILALENPSLREKARDRNRELVRQRAEVNLVRAQMKVFYQQFE